LSGVIAASRLADEDDPFGAETLCQKPDGAGDSPTDPRGAETGCHTELFVGNVASSVAMDKLNLIGDFEFFSAEFRLLGEQQAHIDTDTGDSVIACPGTQHLAGTAAEVEYTGPWFQAQCRTERGELFRREWVMDAVSTFGNGEDSWDVQCEKLLLLRCVITGIYR
jgi:hypothetical protein